MVDIGKPKSHRTDAGQVRRRVVGDGGVDVGQTVEDYCSDFEYGQRYIRSGPSGTNPHQHKFIQNNAHEQPDTNTTGLHYQQQPPEDSSGGKSSVAPEHPHRNTFVGNSDSGQISSGLSSSRQSRAPGGTSNVQRSNNGNSTGTSHASRSHNNPAPAKTPLGCYYTGTGPGRLASGLDNQIQFMHGLSTMINADWIFTGSALCNSFFESKIHPVVITESTAYERFHGKSPISNRKIGTIDGVGVPMSGGGHSGNNTMGGGVRIPVKAGYVIDPPPQSSPSGISPVHGMGTGIGNNNPGRNNDGNHYRSKSAGPTGMQQSPDANSSSGPGGQDFTNLAQLDQDFRHEQNNTLSQLEKVISHQNEQNRRIMVLEVGLHSYSNPLPFSVGITWPGAPLAHMEYSDSGSYVFILPPNSSGTLTPPRSNNVRKKINMRETGRRALIEKHTKEGLCMTDKESGLTAIYCDKIMYHYLKKLYGDKFTPKPSGDRYVVFVPEKVMKEAKAEMNKSIADDQFTNYNELAFYLSPIIPGNRIVSKSGGGSHSGSEGGTGGEKRGVKSERGMKSEYYGSGNAGPSGGNNTYSEVAITEKLLRQHFNEGWKDWMHYVQAQIEITFL